MGGIKKRLEDGGHERAARGEQSIGKKLYRPADPEFSIGLLPRMRPPIVSGFFGEQRGEGRGPLLLPRAKGTVRAAGQGR